jgi:hypothetical protein
VPGKFGTSWAERNRYSLGHDSCAIFYALADQEPILSSEVSADTNNASAPLTKYRLTPAADFSGSQE